MQPPRLLRSSCGPSGGQTNGGACRDGIGLARCGGLERLPTRVLPATRRCLGCSSAAVRARQCGRVVAVHARAAQLAVEVGSGATAGAAVRGSCGPRAAAPRPSGPGRGGQGRRARARRRGRSCRQKGAIALTLRASAISIVQPHSVSRSRTHGAPLMRMSDMGRCPQIPTRQGRGLRDARLHVGRATDEDPSLRRPPEALGAIGFAVAYAQLTESLWD